FWCGDPRLAVSRFKYVRDRLFLACCLLYGLNRWLIKPHVHSPFLRYHFNDLLLIPCALPPLLLAQRWLRLRKHDDATTVAEIGLNLIVWSILFEVLGPHIFRWASGDRWVPAVYD